MAKDKMKRITLQGVEVQWAVVQAPQDNYDKDGTEYRVDVKIPADKLAKLKKIGFTKNPTKGKDKKPTEFYKFTKPTTTRQGKELAKPPVFDKYGNEFTDLVGNGSICDVRLFVFPYGPAKDKWSFRYDGLVVRELVEYGNNDPKEGFEFESKDGDVEVEEEFF